MSDLPEADRLANEGLDPPKVVSTTVKLHATTDAREWADEFIRTFNRALVINHEDNEPERAYVTPGTMVTWFANAIEIGRTAGSEHPWPENEPEFAGGSDDAVTIRLAGFLSTLWPLSVGNPAEAVVLARFMRGDGKQAILRLLWE